MMVWLYRFGFVVDALLLALASGNALMMPAGLDDEDVGLTGMGRFAVWAIPLAVLGLIVGARALRARGALVAATVLLWLPALPFGVMLVFWGGMAALFLLLSR